MDPSFLSKKFAHLDEIYTNVRNMLMVANDTDMFDSYLSRLLRAHITGKVRKAAALS